MKRYVLFGFADYYPGGGWADFVAASDDIEKLKDRAKKGEEYEVGGIVKYGKCENYEIVDLNKLKEVWSD